MPGNYSTLFGSDGRVTNEAVVALVTDCKTAAETDYFSVLSKTKRRYSLYSGVHEGDIASYRSNIHLPILFSYVWTDVANKVQTLFGQFPFVEFSSEYSGPAAKAAKFKADALVSQQLLDSKSIEKAVDFFTTADIYGTAFARVGYAYEQRPKTYRKVILGREQRITVPTVFKDAPDWEVLDILDVLPEPRKRRIEDCNYVIVRYFRDLDDLMGDQVGPYPKWDQAGLSELQRNPNFGQVSRNYNDRLGLYRNNFDKPSSARSYAKPVELWEFWGKVPSEFAIDGVRDVVITVANGMHVLRYESNPFDHGRIPILTYTPMPNPHYFHGTGKIEVGEKMQATINRIINQRLDGVDHAIDPRYVADENLGLPDNLISRAGKVFKVNGAIGADRLQPLIPDIRGIQLAGEEIMFLSRFMQQGTGIIDDVVAGISAGNRTTAREYLGRRETSQGRLMLEAMLAEHMFLGPLAEQFMLLNQQFLPMPSVVQRIGAEAYQDPLTGAVAPPDPQLMTLEELNSVYRPRAIGATRMASRATRLQDLLMISAEVKTNPVGLQIFNWYAFFHELVKVADFDPARLLLANVPAVAAAAAMPGGEPGAGEGLMGQGTSNLEQLSPEALGPQAANPIGGGYSG